MATKTANANVNANAKKEFTLKQVFAMWKRTSKNGKPYFSGKDVDGHELRGFYNMDKKNPNEPDLRIYYLTEKGEIPKEEFLSLWCNATENNKKYLSGKLAGKRVVGFINAKATDENNQPYISIYWSDDQSKPDPKATKNTKAQKKEEIHKDDDLLF